VGRRLLNAYRDFARIRDRVFTVASRGAFASFGPRSVIQLPVRLSGEEAISIGSDVVVGPNSWLNVVPGTGGRITIGDGTYTSGFITISAASSIRIGTKVMIARYVIIADCEHEFGDIRIPIWDQGIRRVQPVEIADWAWLGQGAYIGPGVKVGKGAVVGANSVVLNDVPDYCVAVGAPARIIRRLTGADVKDAIGLSLNEAE
jgi:acetyltransferase-like isoleucine patch superfamily enzyme